MKVVCWAIISALLFLGLPLLSQEPQEYGAAIEQSVKAVGGGVDGQRLREELLQSQKAWRARSHYKAVRNLVASLGPARDQFRIEVGNVNAGVYRVVWIVESPAGVTAFSNVFSGSDIKRIEVSRSDWEKLKGLLDLHRDAAARCVSNLAVSDGSSYFGSIDLDGSRRQFALYGAVPFIASPEEVRSSYKPCGELIASAYALVYPGRHRVVERQGEYKVEPFNAALPPSPPPSCIALDLFLSDMKQGGQLKGRAAVRNDCQQDFAVQIAPIEIRSRLLKVEYFAFEALPSALYARLYIVKKGLGFIDSFLGEAAEVVYGPPSSIVIPKGTEKDVPLEGATHAIGILPVGEYTAVLMTYALPGEYSTTVGTTLDLSRAVELHNQHNKGARQAFVPPQALAISSRATSFRVLAEERGRSSCRHCRQ